MTTTLLRIPGDAAEPTATVQVGAAELHVLQDRLNRFLSIADQRNKDFDPVTSLKSTGDVIRAAGKVIATAEPHPHPHPASPASKA